MSQRRIETFAIDLSRWVDALAEHAVEWYRTRPLLARSMANAVALFIACWTLVVLSTPSGIAEATAGDAGAASEQAAATDLAPTPRTPSRTPAPAADSTAASRSGGDDRTPDAGPAGPRVRRGQSTRPRRVLRGRGRRVRGIRPIED
jgi:hypothetical protein